MGLTLKEAGRADLKRKKEKNRSSKLPVLLH
jgi:hypothetical protein